MAPVPRNAVLVLSLDGRQVAVTVHAARRWALRVRSDERRRLKEIVPDIRRIAAACAVLVRDAPAWLGPREGEPAADEWIMFGPDIAMPVRGGVAVTTLDRASLAPERREWRKKRRQARRAARRALSKGDAAPARRFDDKWRAPKIYGG